MFGALGVLQDSVIAELEKGKKGSVVPVFHEAMALCLTAGESHLPAEKIEPLKRDLEKITSAFLGPMKLSEPTVMVNVPVHETGYSPFLGIPVKKDARKVIGKVLASYLDMCETALSLGCGFGKFSAPQEAVAEAAKNLRRKFVEGIVALDGEEVKIRVSAISSNNDLEQGWFADGLWAPYKTMGFVRIGEKHSWVAGFYTQYDYQKEEWDILRFGGHFKQDMGGEIARYAEFLAEILDGDAGDATSSSVELATLKASPAFQWLLMRVCNRWIR